MEHIKIPQTLHHNPLATSPQGATPQLLPTSTPTPSPATCAHKIDVDSNVLLIQARVLYTLLLPFAHRPHFSHMVTTMGDILLFSSNIASCSIEEVIASTMTTLRMLL